MFFHLDSVAKETTIFSPEIMNQYSAEEYANAAFAMASEEKFILLKSALLAAIRELPKRQQTVINFYYWDGLPVAEIARRIKVHRNRYRSQDFKSGMRHNCA